jgi:ParB family chromosome partitioning protein
MNNTGVEVKEEIIEVNPRDIVIGDNYRKNYTKQSIDEMAESIKKRGILHHPVVAKVQSGNGKYDLVAGQRRLLGAIRAELPTIKVILRKDIKDYNELKELQMIENEHREELSFYDRAYQFADQVNRGKKTPEEIAHDAGKGVDFINYLIRFTTLPKEVQEAVKSGKLSGLHARALLRLKDEKQIVAVSKKAIKEKWSARELSEQISRGCVLNNAKFDKTECQNCPFRSGNQKVLDDIEDENRCLSAACFNNKQGAYYNAILTAHKQKGGKVLSEKDREKLGYGRSHTDINPEWNKPPLYKTKCKKGCPNYALYLKNLGSRQSGTKNYELEEVCLDSNCWKSQERRPSTTSTGDDDGSYRQKQMEESRKIAIKEYVRSFLAKRVTELVKGQSLVNTIMLTEFMTDFEYDEAANEILKEEKGKNISNYLMRRDNKEKFYSLISEWKPEKQVKYLIRFLNEQVKHYSSPVLTAIGKDFGVDIKKDFYITEEYLNIKTKEEVLSLAKELGIKEVIEAGKTESTAKKELIAIFLKSNIKGKIPKEVLKAVED